MSNLHHVCSECDSEFTIKYDTENCDDDPRFCPFCAQYILETEEIEDDDL